MTKRLDQPTGTDEGGNHHARTRAKAVAEFEGVSKLQALQRVLYRSAKQDPTRRFHAIYDKLARSDVMWQAWINVATNQGAPGIDGISIADITAEKTQGVRQFLDGDRTPRRLVGRDLELVVKDLNPGCGAGGRTSATATRRGSSP